MSLAIVGCDQATVEGIARATFDRVAFLAIYILSPSIPPAIRTSIFGLLPLLPAKLSISLSAFMLLDPRSSEFDRLLEDLLTRLPTISSLELLTQVTSTTFINLLPPSFKTLALVQCVSLAPGTSAILKALAERLQDRKLGELGNISLRNVRRSEIPAGPTAALESACRSGDVALEWEEQDSTRENVRLSCCLGCGRC